MKNPRTPPSRTKGFVTTLPFRSQQIDDADANFDVSVWRSAENLCELENPDTRCDTVAGLYYGSAEDEVVKFCPRHFYQMHSASGAPYRLDDVKAGEATTPHNPDQTHE
jgi:hypothetical protein